MRCEKRFNSHCALIGNANISLSPFHLMKGFTNFFCVQTSSASTSTSAAAHCTLVCWTGDCTYQRCTAATAVAVAVAAALTTLPPTPLRRRQRRRRRSILALSNERKKDRKARQGSSGWNKRRVEKYRKVQWPLTSDSWSGALMWLCLCWKEPTKKFIFEIKKSFVSFWMQCVVRLKTKKAAASRTRRQIRSVTLLPSLTHSLSTK